jgi:hypothetical protein
MGRQCAGDGLTMGDDSLDIVSLIDAQAACRSLDRKAPDPRPCAHCFD